MSQQMLTSVVEDWGEVYWPTKSPTLRQLLPDALKQTISLDLSVMKLKIVSTCLLLTTCRESLRSSLLNTVYDRFFYFGFRMLFSEPLSH